jgi:mono/diheme cytochrome c family protein
MRQGVWLLLWVLALVLAACGGAPGAGEAATGDEAAGEELFAQTLIGNQPGCSTCHSLEPGGAGVGPSLATIGAEAGSRVSGMSAEEYLRQSIEEPNAHIAEGFAAGIMPAALADALSAQQLNDMVAYLLTLK